MEEKCLGVPPSDFAIQTVGLSAICSNTTSSRITICKPLPSITNNISKRKALNSTKPKNTLILKMFVVELGVAAKRPNQGKVGDCQLYQKE